MKPKDTPSKSSLSEVRSKISFKFFEDIYSDHLNNVTRGTYRGFYVYAIDGDQLDLPASKNVLDEGYRGYPTSRNRETHYPKMYTVQSYDLVNQLITNFKFGKSVAENQLAQEMVRDFEPNSISIYDRLYCGYKTFLSHIESKNYFIVRARMSGSGCNSEIMKFKASSKRSSLITWKPSARYRVAAESLKLRLVKVKNSRSGEDIIFVTNLMENQITDKDIGILYQRRWNIETSFKDLTHTLKMNQFHSKSMNGILQEIFALLWFVNNLKSKIRSLVDQPITQERYKKSNFKLCAEIVMKNYKLLLQKQLIKFNKILEFWILKSIENRKHLSRMYPRAVRLRGRGYALLNVVPKRLTERH